MSTHTKLNGHGSFVALMILILVILTPSLRAAESGLAGLWEARRNFGPAVSGPLHIRKLGTGLFAEIAGQRIPVTTDEGRMRFSLADGSAFNGHIDATGNITGHWTQVRSKLDGNIFSTPVDLAKSNEGWWGQILPQADTGNFFLMLRQTGTGLAADIVNPERNLGIFLGLTRLEQNGDDITLLGSFLGRGDEGEMLRGRYERDEDVLAFRYPGRGGAYDFHRVAPEQATGFLARPVQSGPLLAPPPPGDDGWSVALPKEVGLDERLIEKMILEHVLPAPMSTRDLSIHSVLIARHGKLVIEEYFHNHDREQRHDSRSASKSVVSVLVAALMYNDLPLSWDTPVYSTLKASELLASDPRRGDILLRHLANMNTGLDCDDRNANSAANENYLWDHADEIDFYQHTLHVDVLHKPGEHTAYCSASPNLAGAVIGAATGRSLASLIEEYVAEPLEIESYSIPHSPDGHPFMGGGIRWRARDFLKFPQLLLDGGQWKDQRILSREDVEMILTPTVKMDGGRDYGFLWWTEDYPYQGETVRAHFMGGNGGQIAMLIPELEIAMVFNAGNYSDRAGYRIQEELIPNYILPAIMD